MRYRHRVPPTYINWGQFFFIICTFITPLWNSWRPLRTHYTTQSSTAGQLVHFIVIIDETFNVAQRTKLLLGPQQNVN